MEEIYSRNFSDRMDDADSVDLEEISDDETEEDTTIQSSLDKNTNLHYSAALGIVEKIERDLESPEQKIDAENFLGWTPLMMAVRNGRVEVVKLLLEKGADVTKRNKFGANIFTMSIASCNMKMMETILLHMLRGGISRNRIQQNMSPLALAILFRNEAVFTWLIEQGFDLNAMTPKTALTPLMFAAAVAPGNMMHLLESKGAKQNVKNFMRFSHKDILRWKGRGLDNIRKKGEIEKIAVKPQAQSKVKPATELKIQITDTEKEAPDEKISYRVPNNSPSTAMNETTMSEAEKIQLISEKMARVSVTPNGHVNNSRSVDLRRDVLNSQIRNNLQVSPQYFTTPYQSPANFSYPDCMPVQNSPFIAAGFSNQYVSPMYLTSPYWLPNMELARSTPTPTGIVHSPQNVYQSSQVFFPPQFQVQDVNYAHPCYPHDFNEGNSMCYQMLAPPQNIYAVPTTQEKRF